MDRKQLTLLGTLFVLMPTLWSGVKFIISAYDQWVQMSKRVERIERWKCAMGNKHDPAEIDWQRECKR